MSRIGRKPVARAADREGLDRRLDDPDRRPQGQAQLHAPARDRRQVSTRPAGQILVTRADDERLNRSLHGLTRSLVANMVQGVTTGYTKKLEIVGVGYQAQLKKANTVALQVGYANQVVLEAPPGVSVAVPTRRTSRISGPDKQAVGQFAADCPQGAPSRALQGQGNPLRGRVRPPQGRQGLRRRSEFVIQQV